MSDKVLTLECPRCDETDVCSIGMNKCGLCDCEFFVSCNGSYYAPAKRPLGWTNDVPFKTRQPQR